MTASSRGNALFEIAVYFIASARLCLEEPVEYAAFRMIEGVGRMVDAANASEEFVADAFLVSARTTIGERKWQILGDKVAFRAALDELLREFAGEAKRRNLAGPRLFDSPAVVPPT